MGRKSEGLKESSTWQAPVNDRIHGCMRQK